jgi:hypothetical protein
VIFIGTRYTLYTCLNTNFTSNIDDHNDNNSNNNTEFTLYFPPVNDDKELSLIYENHHSEIHQRCKRELESEIE